MKPLLNLSERINNININAKAHQNKATDPKRVKNKKSMLKKLEVCFLKYNSFRPVRYWFDRDFCSEFEKYSIFLRHNFQINCLIYF